MSNLNHANPLMAGYEQIYQALIDLREGFHRSGRLDDSNAKLDEVSKLFATYLSFKNGQIPNFPSVGSNALVEELQFAFKETVKLPHYQLHEGGSIFGLHPTLAIRSGDEELAAELVKLVSYCVDLAFELRTQDSPFDILNEAFGHFVRDNFRSNIEDAQYMTPPEVVDFIVDLVLHDISQEDHAANDANKHWTFLDPTCGVGSFLAGVYNRACKSEWLSPTRLRLFGQDKVERMVRLSTINLELFDVEKHRITVGNSLELGSTIDDLNDGVDVILTNPPFGARFGVEEVASKFKDNTPFFSSLRRTASSLDSELLFIDRNLKLLRDGGRLLIVIPDGVVSAKGVAALLRQHLSNTATVRAVIELPATTFAQAGTRTKTAILYLQKGKPNTEIPVFMGIVKDLGFQVSSKKGTQVKIPEGANELPRVLDFYKKRSSSFANDVPVIANASPSCVWVPLSTIAKGSWTPNHYSAARFEAVASLARCPDFQLIPLGELVEFCADSRKAGAWEPGCAFISILHILGEGFVDVGGALSYSPKTPGVPTNSGELLLSRINPRIPRVCVVPDFGEITLCSSEFEIMMPKSTLDVHTLAYLLQTSIVQGQICSLTSGTSASHNRIRTSELSQVIIPVPKPGTAKAALIFNASSKYRDAIESLGKSSLSLAKIRVRDKDIFDI